MAQSHASKPSYLIHQSLALVKPQMSAAPAQLCYNVTRGPDQNNQPKLVQDSQFQKLDEIREFSSVRFLFLYMLLNLETGGEFVMQQLMTNTSQAINYAEVKAEE